MRFLLVDGPDLLARCAANAGLQGLSTKAGEPTGARFGFLRSLRAHRRHVGAGRACVAWGDPGETASHPEEASLRKIIGLTEYSQAWSVAYRACDVLAALAKQLSSSGHEVVVGSRDRRLWALYSGRLVGWQPNGKKGSYVGPEDVRREYRVPSYHLPFLLAAIEALGDGPEAADLRALLRGLPPPPREEAGVKDHFDYYLAALSLSSMPPSLADRFARQYLEPPSRVTITRGARDLSGLVAELSRLEMQSLVKCAGDFVGGQEELP